MEELEESRVDTDEEIEDEIDNDELDSDDEEIRLLNEVIKTTFLGNAGNIGYCLFGAPHFADPLL